MKKLVLIFTLSMMVLGFVWGQTNPTAHDLASSNYTFAGFANGTTTTYPVSMQGWAFSSEPGSSFVTAPNSDRALVANSTSITTGSIRNEVGNGISLLNSGTNHIGAIVVSLKTNGRKDITLSWTAADMIESATRINGLKLQYRIGTSGNFTDVAGTQYTSLSGSAAPAASFSNIALSSDANDKSVVQVRWLYYFVSGTGSRDRIRLDDITISSSPAGGSPTPSITVDPSSLSNFTYVHGSGPSTEKTFTISGSDLTANISIAAPTNYEISKTSGSGYASPLTLTQSGGSVANTIIYVRLKAGLGVGNYNNENITASSSGADSKTVTCGGSVTTPPPPIAPVASNASNIEATKFTANWNSASGASGYKLDVYTKTDGANASDLFISEYIEGSSGNNKAIEIYNGTGVSVDLSNYTLQKQTNGAGAFGGNFALSGTLASGSVHIVAHSGADAAIKDLADQITGGSPLDFNGNDCVALYKNGVMIDLVGVIDQVSPDWGANMTLVRKENATVPNTTYSVSDWDSHTPETTDYLGSHTFAGGVTKDYVTGYNNLDVSNNLSKQVTGLNPNTTYYYVVRAYDSYSQTSGNSNEIEVSTTQAYDYPDGEEIDAGDVLIEIVGGNGNIVDRPLTNVPNPTFVATFEQAIELFDVDDDNYWLISIFAPYDEWGACLVDNAWISETVDEDGYLLFEIDLSETKGTIIEIKTGNGGNPTLPVELSSFTATMHAQNYVQLTWITQTETGVLGYYIYRSSENDLSSALKISDMIAATNTSQTQCYVYVDKELNENGTHYYWLENVDFDGSHQYHGPVFIEYSATDINPSPIPLITRINSVYPNPFNPSTRIPFELAKAAEVKIEIYNTRGQLVKSYPVQSKDMGNHYVEWDGSSDRGEACATGVYYIKMHTGNKTYSTKAVMIK